MRRNAWCCPECRSHNIGLADDAVIDSNSVCKDCGHKWDRGEDTSEQDTAPDDHTQVQPKGSDVHIPSDYQKVEGDVRVAKSNCLSCGKPMVYTGYECDECEAKGGNIFGPLEDM